VRSKKLARIGKEVDRLDEEEGAALEPEQPIEYERDDLAEDIEHLATFPQTATASDLGLTERGWRKIIRCGPNRKQRRWNGFGRSRLHIAFDPASDALALLP
jgi:hypothetical protein